MPKIIPVADELSKPFWDAVNEKRFILQNCTACSRLQYPPRQSCIACGSRDKLEWKEVAGTGHIPTSLYIENSRLTRPVALSVRRTRLR